MRMNSWLAAGIGLGLAAVAYKNKSSCRNRSGEERYNEHDATLLGKKAHQTDIGGPTASHIKEGIGRTLQPEPPAV
jgi:hypothetical protein